MKEKCGWMAVVLAPVHTSKRLETHGLGGVGRCGTVLD